MILKAIIVGIIFFLGIFFIFVQYLNSQKNKFAFLKEIQNKNDNILLRSQAFILKKQKIYTSTYNDKKVILDVFPEKPITIYYDERKDFYTNKNLLINKNKVEDITFAEITESYIYKISVHDNQIKKESKIDIDEKEFVVYKNPYDGTIYFESDIDESKYNIVPEMEFFNSLNKSLIKYFLYNNKYQELQKISEKDMLDVIKPCTITTFVLTFIYILIINFIK